MSNYYKEDLIKAITNIRNEDSIDSFTELLNTTVTGGGLDMALFISSLYITNEPLPVSYDSLNKQIDSDMSDGETYNDLGLTEKGYNESVKLSVDAGLVIVDNGLLRLSETLHERIGNALFLVREKRVNDKVG